VHAAYSRLTADASTTGAITSASPRARTRPARAWGESFWAFLPRTVKGSLISSWELEAERLDRVGASAGRRANDILSAWLMSAVLFGALVAVFGLVVAPYLLV